MLERIEAVELVLSACHGHGVPLVSYPGGMDESERLSYPKSRVIVRKFVARLDNRLGQKHAQ